MRTTLNPRPIASGLLAAVTMLVASTATAVLPKDYESPPVVTATEVVPASLLQSESHRLSDDVVTSGNFFQFRLDTELGHEQVVSLGLLAIRVREARTLAQVIHEVRRNEGVAADKQRGQLRVGGDSWIDILTSPVSAASSLAGQLADNVGRTVNELNELPAGRAAGADTRRQTGGVAEAHRRNAASQLGLDPYSSNPKVQRLLTLLARKRSGGRIGSGIMHPVVRRAADRRVANGALDREIERRLRNLTPEELDDDNAHWLSEMGVEAGLRDGFLRHRNFSPRHKTVIVAHLGLLENTRHRHLFFEAANSATSEPDALSYERWARMLALYDEQVEKLTALRPTPMLPVAVTAGGTAALFLPVDIVYWSAELEAIAEGVGGNASKVLVVTGGVTERARAELAQRAFQVQEHFLDAP